MYRAESELCVKEVFEQLMAKNGVPCSGEVLEEEHGAIWSIARGENGLTRLLECLVGMTSVEPKSWGT